LRAAALLLLVLGASTPVGGRAQTPDPVRVTYLTGGSAYIDAGRNDGLAEGDSLRVLRGGAEIAMLRVEFLSSRQASCGILAGGLSLAVGDTVDLTRRPAGAELAADSTVPVARPVATRPTRGSRVKGRVGLRYLGVWQRDAGKTRLSQPSLDLRLDGEALGGTPFGVVLDVRARRTATSRADGTTVADGRTRVYRGGLLFAHPGSPVRVTAGRQFAAAVSSVSLFDGLQVEWQRPGWSAGMFGGSEPDPVSMAYSGEVRDWGAWIQLHRRPESERYWSATLGGVGSYTHGTTNREFLFVQGGYGDGRLSLAVTQELDYYRAWKQAMGESPWSLTSTFGSLRYELTPSLSLSAGYDNRRSVRLYRDAVTPEIAFDDVFRRGAWGGLAVRLRDARLALDARSSTGGTLGRTTAFTLHAGLQRVAGSSLGLRSRTTRYDGPRESGWLEALSLDLTPAPAVLVTLEGGLRLAHDPLADPPDRTVSWLGADLDLNLGRRWYWNASLQHESGALEATDQVFTGLTYRF
jgi:hypothetical protein